MNNKDLERIMKAVKEVTVAHNKNEGYGKIFRHLGLDVCLLLFSPRVRSLLRLRYGLEDGVPRTLEEVGKDFGISKERVRSIETKSLEDLKHHMYVFLGKDPFVSLRNAPKQECTREHTCTEEPKTYTPIEILNFSPRTLNALINGGIDSIEQLTQCTEGKIINMRGVGKVALKEVIESLQRTGKDLTPYL